MSNDDWYLIVDDDDDERVVLESSSCYQSQSQMDQNLQLPLKRNHTTTSAFDDKILMPPPAAIVKRARVDDEDIVDLISESDSDCSESISIIIEDAIQVSVTSSTNRNQIGKENNMNSSNTSIMSLAQRLHAKTIALGPSQQHPTNLNLSNQLPMTSTPSVAKSSSNSSSSSSSSSSYVPPSNATQRQHMNTMLDRSESIYAGDVGMRSAPNSQTSVASSHNSSNNSKIVFNSFCPSHDPSKHGGRAIVDMTDDIEIPTSQPLTQQHSQSQLQQEELTSMSLGEESMHRVLTAEQLQSWVVVLLVDQREKEHAFQQAKLLVFIFILQF